MNAKKENEEKLTRAQKKERKKAAVMEAEDKERIYRIRKGAALMALRILIWIMLGFLCVRGVIVSLRPDSSAQAMEIIAQFRKEMSARQESETEVAAFAEAFAVQYFTYEDISGTEGLQNYRDRLALFASDDLLSTLKKAPAGSSARVLYAQAYRQEPFSETQTDVWVYLQVEYTTRTLSQEGIETENRQVRDTTVKIPVLCGNGVFLVEDTPLFVSDDRRAEADAADPGQTVGPEADKTAYTAAKESLSNFFTAYYGGQQSVISYYLDPAARQTDFLALRDRLAFQSLKLKKLYYTSETVTDELTALVSVSGLDENGAELLQNYHLTLCYRDEQYYVRAMDARGTK